MLAGRIAKEYISSCTLKLVISNISLLLSILPATKCYQQWIKATYLKKDCGANVATSWENIICRFGIPKRLLFDNDSSFVNRHV